VLEGAPLAEAAARFGYSPSALASLVRDFRAGKLALLAEPGRPRAGPPVARARRRRTLPAAGSSSCAARACRSMRSPPGRGHAAQPHRGRADPGRGGLRPAAASPREPEASISPATPGRATNLPPARVIDFPAFPATASTRLAGLLLAVPDLVALELPALARKAGYPGTKVIPAVSWLLSLLALKLTATRRVSHAGDLPGDPASALFAGLAILPKKSALTSCSPPAACPACACCGCPEMAAPVCGECRTAGCQPGDPGGLPGLPARRRRSRRVTPRQASPAPAIILRTDVPRLGAGPSSPRTRARKHNRRCEYITRDTRYRAAPAINQTARTSEPKKKSVTPGSAGKATSKTRVRHRPLTPGQQLILPVARGACRGRLARTTRSRRQHDLVTAPH